MSYITSKVGVHFYHSLPMTRERLYLQEIGCRILWFAVPMAFATLFGILTTGAITGVMNGGVALIFGRIFLYSFTYFLVFYAIMIFAASFTGTGFARLLAAGMIVFMPTILVLCVYLIFDYSAFRASYEWISDAAIELMLPCRAAMLAAD